MKTIELATPVFVLLGAIVIAPHISEEEAKVIAFICGVAAVIFFLIAGVIREN